MLSTDLWKGKNTAFFQIFTVMDIPTVRQYRKFSFNGDLLLQ